MPTPRPLDPRSVAGKVLHTDEACQVLVIGAGPAGLAAALAAAEAGAATVLVDENPVPLATMGEDVPLHFGSGASAVARNRTAMLEAIVANDPGLERAFEAGIDVRLGQAVFGLYGNGASVGWLPGLLAALTDGESSTLLRCERVIVAAGRRDMGVAFPGWTLPGIMGLTAAERLATLYGALSPREVVVLGSTAETLLGALSLQQAGIRIAALVEQAEAPVGPPDLVRRLRESGTEILTRHIPREAVGRDAVEALMVQALAPDGRVVQDAPERRIACEAVILGIGTTPVIELLDALGCRTGFQVERGGYAPVLDARGRTSVPRVWAVGDAAGIWPAKTTNRALAEHEGRMAGRDAAASLGFATIAEDPPPPPPAPATDLAAYRLDWVRASVVEARAEPVVCQCEEVTAREILEVRPPRYLGVGVDRRNDRSLRALLGETPPHPDQVKRLTRARMGPCQGRRCREQVACLLALGAAVPLHEIPLAGYRQPVRPLSLAAASDLHEPDAMTREWDTWFGIVPQYRLASELPRLYTVASGNPEGPAASE